MVLIQCSHSNIHYFYLVPFVRPMHQPYPQFVYSVLNFKEKENQKGGKLNLKDPTL